MKFDENGKPTLKKRKSTSIDIHEINYEKYAKISVWLYCGISCGKSEFILKVYILI